jgi:hypothetical protein
MPEIITSSTRTPNEIEFKKTCFTNDEVSLWYILDDEDTFLRHTFLR